MGSMTRSNRSDWITSPPTLDTYSITVRRLQSLPTVVHEVVIEARCNRKRTALWVYTEYFDTKDGDYNLTDALHHFTLVLEQDKPLSVPAFERGLVGAASQQDELPF
jgi:hypothetical protein